MMEEQIWFNQLTEGISGIDKSMIALIRSVDKLTLELQTTGSKMDTLMKKLDDLKSAIPRSTEAMTEGTATDAGSQVGGSS